jgi:hypothetical protein
MRPGIQVSSKIGIFGRCGAAYVGRYWAKEEDLTVSCHHRI